MSANRVVCSACHKQRAARNAPTGGSIASLTSGVYFEPSTGYAFWSVSRNPHVSVSLRPGLRSDRGNHMGRRIVSLLSSQAPEEKGAGRIGYRPIRESGMGGYAVKANGDEYSFPIFAPRKKAAARVRIIPSLSQQRRYQKRRCAPAIALQWAFW